MLGLFLTLISLTSGTPSLADCRPDFRRSIQELSGFRETDQAVSRLNKKAEKNSKLLGPAAAASATWVTLNAGLFPLRIYAEYRLVTERRVLALIDEAYKDQGPELDEALKSAQIGSPNITLQELGAVIRDQNMRRIYCTATKPDGNPLMNSVGVSRSIRRELRARAVQPRQTSPVPGLVPNQAIGAPEGATAASAD